MKIRTHNEMPAWFSEYKKRLPHFMRATAFFTFCLFRFPLIIIITDKNVFLQKVLFFSSSCVIMILIGFLTANTKTQTSSGGSI